MTTPNELRGHGWRADCEKCVGSKFTCDEHYRTPSEPAATDERVEKVARAICRINTEQRCRAARMDAKALDETVECQVANGWDLWVPEARAALAALKAEPAHDDGLVERLRAQIPYQGKSKVAFLCHEAADRIIEQQARIEALKAEPAHDDGLVERLRRNSGWRDVNYQCITDPALLAESAARIEALEAALVEAREALEPFAKAVDDWMDDPKQPNHADTWEHPLAMSVTIGDFRRAAQAIRSLSEGE